jgi:hypothetical protein
MNMFDKKFQNCYIIKEVCPVYFKLNLLHYETTLLRALLLLLTVIIHVLQTNLKLQMFLQKK